MTKKEALQVLAVLKAAYPASYQSMTKEEASGTVSIWCMQFADMPYEIVFMALQKLISTNKFPPTVAEVKEKIKSIHWEAYELLSSRNLELPEANREKYQQIYDVTAQYKYGTTYEPKIHQMVGGQKLLGGG